MGKPNIKQNRSKHYHIERPSSCPKCGQYVKYFKTILYTKATVEKLKEYDIRPLSVMVLKGEVDQYMKEYNLDPSKVAEPKQTEAKEQNQKRAGGFQTSDIKKLQDISRTCFSKCPFGIKALLEYCSRENITVDKFITIMNFRLKRVSNHVPVDTLMEAFHNNEIKNGINVQSATSVFRLDYYLNDLCSRLYFVDGKSRKSTLNVASRKNTIHDSIHSGKVKRDNRIKRNLKSIKLRGDNTINESTTIKSHSAIVEKPMTENDVRSSPPPPPHTTDKYNSCEEKENILKQKQTAIYSDCKIRSFTKGIKENVEENNHSAISKKTMTESVVRSLTDKDNLYKKEKESILTQERTDKNSNCKNLLSLRNTSGGNVEKESNNSAISKKPVIENDVCSSPHTTDDNFLIKQADSDCDLTISLTDEPNLLNISDNILNDTQFDCFFETWFFDDFSLFSSNNSFAKNKTAASDDDTESVKDFLEGRWVDPNSKNRDHFSKKVESPHSETFKKPMSKNDVSSSRATDEDILCEQEKEYCLTNETERNDMSENVGKGSNHTHTAIVKETMIENGLSSPPTDDNILKKEENENLTQKSDSDCKIILLTNNTGENVEEENNVCDSAFFKKPMIGDNFLSSPKEDDFSDKAVKENLATQETNSDGKILSITNISENVGKKSNHSAVFEEIMIDNGAPSSTEESILNEEASENLTQKSDSDGKETLTSDFEENAEKESNHTHTQTIIFENDVRSSTEDSLYKEAQKNCFTQQIDSDGEIVLPITNDTLENVEDSNYSAIIQTASVEIPVNENDDSSSSSDVVIIYVENENISKNSKTDLFSTNNFGGNAEKSNQFENFKQPMINNDVESDSDTKQTVSDFETSLSLTNDIEENVEEERNLFQISPKKEISSVKKRRNQVDTSIKKARMGINSSLSDPFDDIKITLVKTENNQFSISTKTKYSSMSQRKHQRTNEMLNIKDESLKRSVGNRKRKYVGGSDKSTHRRKRTKKSKQVKRETLKKKIDDKTYAKLDNMEEVNDHSVISKRTMHENDVPIILDEGKENFLRKKQTTCDFKTVFSLTNDSGGNVAIGSNNAANSIKPMIGNDFFFSTDDNLWTKQTNSDYKIGLSLRNDFEKNMYVEEESKYSNISSDEENLSAVKSLLDDIPSKEISPVKEGSDHQSKTDMLIQETFIDVNSLSDALDEITLVEEVSNQFNISTKGRLEQCENWEECYFTDFTEEANNNSISLTGLTYATDDTKLEDFLEVGQRTKEALNIKDESLKGSVLPLEKKCANDENSDTGICRWKRNKKSETAKRERSKILKKNTDDETDVKLNNLDNILEEFSSILQTPSIEEIDIHSSRVEDILYKSGTENYFAKHSDYKIDLPLSDDIVEEEKRESNDCKNSSEKNLNAMSYLMLNSQDNKGGSRVEKIKDKNNQASTSMEESFIDYSLFDILDNSENDDIVQSVDNFLPDIFDSLCSNVNKNLVIKDVSEENSLNIDENLLNCFNDIFPETTQPPTDDSSQYEQKHKTSANIYRDCSEECPIRVIETSGDTCNKIPVDDIYVPSEFDMCLALFRASS